MNTEQDPKTILFPAPAWDVGVPAIHGPALTGASPGKDFARAARKAATELRERINQYRKKLQ